jgi:peptidoglycan/LPS O-acetylase OafA/YrhL
VWLGEGRCACLPSLVEAFRQATMTGQSAVFVLLLPPALPFAGTLLLLLARERRGAWAGYLTAWGLAGAYCFLLFVGHWFISHRQVWLWGAGLCGVVAVAMLAGEVLAARENRRKAAQPLSRAI